MESLQPAIRRAALPLALCGLPIYFALRHPFAQEEPRVWPRPEKITPVLGIRLTMRLLFFVLPLLAAAYNDNRLPLRAGSREAPSSLEGMFVSKWEAFKLMFDKEYKTDVEDSEHFVAFIGHLMNAILHNRRFAAGKESFKMGVNELSDMKDEEYAVMNGYRRPENHTRNGLKFMAPQNVKAPDAVNWREHGYVTPVKNQGHCGSCWAFSSTGALEGQTKRVTGKLISLSEQNLVDCSKDNEGCHGGLPDLAFDFIKNEGGLDTEQAYPYEGMDDDCKYSSKTVGATDAGHFDLPVGDEHSLMMAVATQGPISVGIDAHHASFKGYKSGVYYEKECSSEHLTHAVLVVGYGTDPENGDYWLVKNSWGETWGENGYIRMARNRDNHCGIATEASYPLVPASMLEVRQ